MENFSIVTNDGNIKKIRMDLRGDADNFIYSNRCFLTKGFEGCLFLFTKEELKCFQSGVMNLVTDIPGCLQLSYFILVSIQEVIIDREKRQCVFQKNLLEYAQIRNEATIIGKGGIAQVWPKEKAINDVVLADSVWRKLAFINSWS